MDKTIFVTLKKTIVDVEKSFREGERYLVLDIDNVGERFLLADMLSKEMRYFRNSDCLLEGWRD